MITIFIDKFREHDFIIKKKLTNTFQTVFKSDHYITSAMRQFKRYLSIRAL